MWHFEIAIGLQGDFGLRLEMLKVSLPLAGIRCGLLIWIGQLLETALDSVDCLLSVLGQIVEALLSSCWTASIRPEDCSPGAILQSRGNRSTVGPTSLPCSILGGPYVTD